MAVVQSELLLNLFGSMWNAYCEDLEVFLIHQRLSTIIIFEFGEEHVVLVSIYSYI